MKFNKTVATIIGVGAVAGLLAGQVQIYERKRVIRKTRYQERVHPD
jgi:hypothetical protein